MRYFQRSITYFTCFLTKDCTKKSLFCRKLCLSLRSNFTNKDIAGTYFSTDADNTTLIQIFQCIVAHARNITCDLFRSQFGITGFAFIFFNMNRCINIVHNKSFTEEYRILVVITFPCHESDQRVLTKSKFSVCCGRTICDNLSCLYVLTLEYDWFLVVTVTLVTSQIFSQMVIIFCTIIILNADICRCGTKYSTRFLCNYADTGVNCCLHFHTSTNYRSLCCQKRHSLTLHV